MANMTSFAATIRMQWPRGSGHHSSKDKVKEKI